MSDEGGNRIEEVSKGSSSSTLGGELNVLGVTIGVKLNVPENDVVASVAKPLD